jgi:hypothetical protein
MRSSIRRSAIGIGALLGAAAATGAASLLVFGTGPVALTSAAGGGGATGGLNLSSLQIGDGKRTTKGARRGYVYSCQSSFGMAGASVAGPWIHGSTWDATSKITVDGKVHWGKARLRVRWMAKKLKLSGNGLPKHVTGKFPISSSDDAYSVDHNPNSISAYKLLEKLPKNPKRARRPSCLSLGTIGVMRSGAALFDALDGGGNDAAAHEVQDRCGGHPQQSGVYHYHARPSCIGTGKKNRQSKLIGWALDGFPIYGPRGKGGRYLRNSDLDKCHGIKSRVRYRGKWRRIYHYVATMEYPYTLGCYRGTPVTGGSTGPSGGPPPGGPPGP